MLFPRQGEYNEDIVVDELNPLLVYFVWLVPHDLGSDQVRWYRKPMTFSRSYAFTMGEA